MTIRDGRQAGGLAALKRFRAGYAPNCGEYVGRKVHGVQPLHQAALDHWGLVPLARRGEVLARAASSLAVAADSRPPRVLSQAVVNERVAWLVDALSNPITQE